MKTMRKNTGKTEHARTHALTKVVWCNIYKSRCSYVGNTEIVGYIYIQIDIYIYIDEIPRIYVRHCRTATKVVVRSQKKRLNEEIRSPFKF